MSEPRPSTETQAEVAPHPSRLPLGATRWAIFLAIALWAGSCALWTAATLPWTKGPDEGDHFEYAYFLLHTRALPDPSVDPVLEAHHPPLAYIGYAGLLGALIEIDHSLEDSDFAGRKWQRFLGRETTFDPKRSLAEHLGIDLEAVRTVERESGITDDRMRVASGVLQLRSWAFYTLRLPAVLLCVWTLFLILGCMRYLFPQAPGYALVMTAAIGSMPAYSFYFATVSNDPLVTWLSVLAIWLTLRARHRGQLLEFRPLLWISVVLGLAFLTKLHAIGAAAFCALCVLSATGPGRWGPRIRALLILAAGPLILAAWWHLRQTMLQGSPIATQNHADFRPELLRLGERHPSLAVDFFSSMISSFFGRFGNDTLVLPPIYYFPLEGVVMIAMLGLALFRRSSERWSFAEAGGQHDLPRMAAVVGVVLVVANLLKLDFTYNAHSGRYLMPLIVPLAIGLAAGLARTLGRNASAVLTVIVGWNLVFGCLFYGVVFRNAYSIEADKVARGGVIAYYDAGNELFDQPSAGGNILAQRFGMWTLPNHTMRLARQAPGKPALVYRTPLPEVEPPPLQVRVRYPSMKGVADTDVPDPYGIEMIANDATLHGPMSIWGEFGEYRYPVPASALRGRESLNVWWENRIRLNPIVAVTELWVEEAWLQAQDVRLEGEERRRVALTMRNIDHDAPHAAALFVMSGDRLLATRRDQTLAPRESRKISIELPAAVAEGESLQLRLVDEAPSVWSHTKIGNWLKVPPTRSGRLEVPDVAVLRHRNHPDRETLLAEARFPSAPPGTLLIEIGHLASQDPLRKGQLRLEVEGGSADPTLRHRAEPGISGLARSGFHLRREAGPLLIRVIAEAESDGESYDLDRIWITPVIGPESAGHLYPVTDPR
jgi:Dolichyl-phosphate-mannose-protein mannosyltransferase